MNNLVGEILSNRYKIVRELGTGGMAWVYQAEDLKTRQEVAVKVLYPQYSDDVSYIQRFTREARLAIKLSSPHIVKVLNYGSDRETHYLVMEKVAGEDLKSVIQRRGALPYQETLGIAVHVARALNHANEHGIVHRDIKPENLMVTPDGTVKVLDFGIARARTLPSITQSGFIGSPYYISPEQAMGETVDIRSDIYSLGIVMYEMLSGKLPFDASSPWSIISQHIANKPPVLTLSGTDLPRPMEDLVNRALAKDPADRFQTPAELMTAIEAVMGGKELPRVALPPTPRSRQVRDILLQSLYDRAIEATQAEKWPRAVNLFNQVLKIEPAYRDAAQKLAYAGLHARLSALYLAARRAMEAERWQEAVDELSEIVSVEPEYRDAVALLSSASLSLMAQRTAEESARLYEQAIAYFDSGEWDASVACLEEVRRLDPAYRDVKERLDLALRESRRARSPLNRLLVRMRGGSSDETGQ
ncbi:MAG: protein kinase [Chloroflexota bacterium]|nr:protein kinase [Chloroflexota bacterium]